MADDVTLPGTGEIIATDEVGARQFQLVKLDGGGNGVSVPIVASTVVPGESVAALPVRIPDQQVWVCSFAGSGSILSADLTLRRLGTGFGQTQGGGNLVVTTGTTVNAEFLARSVDTFNAAMIARWRTILSQRIVNQNFAVMLADRIGEGLAVLVNSATSISVTLTAHGFTAENVGQFMNVGAINGVAGVPGRYAIASIPNANTINFTVSGWPASGSGTLDLFGWNYLRSLYSGATATAMSVDTQRRGWADTAIAATINTTASPGHIGQMHVDGRNFYVSDMLSATSATPNVTVRGSRVENLPDPDVQLHFYVWAWNGTVAPASTTTWTVGFLTVENFCNLPVYIAGQRMQGGAAAAPVAIVGTVPVSGTVTANIGTGALAAGANAIGDVGQQYRANATGAASRTHLVSAATANPTIVKAAAGRVLGWQITNTNAAYRYVKLHNIATAPTAGTGVVQTIGVPPNATVNYSLEGGIAFATGIGLTTVTGAADADATAVGANDLVIDLFFA